MEQYICTLCIYLFTAADVLIDAIAISLKTSSSSKSKCLFDIFVFVW